MKECKVYPTNGIEMAVRPVVVSCSKNKTKTTIDCVTIEQI